MGLMASMLLCRAQAPTLSGEQKQAIEKLVPNKGTLVRPVSYAFTPQDIYEALKDKYNK